MTSNNESFRQKAAIFSQFTSVEEKCEYVYELLREGANKRGNSSRLTQSFHFFMFEPIFSPVNALNQPI
ncbi:hypothetical protein WM44_21545 [Citrobacter sp. AATXQ]|nr:hypothetical protein WM44_21545 [Citrobacter sp. AATXQ]